VFPTFEISRHLFIPELFSIVSTHSQTTTNEESRTAAARELHCTAAILGTAVSSSLWAGYVPSFLSAHGIERCAREFRRVFSTSCIVYLAPFTRLLAGIDYLAITVFRIVRGHSCLSVVPFSPFLSPVMAPAPPSTSSFLSPFPLPHLLPCTPRSSSYSLPLRFGPELRSAPADA